MNFHQNETQWYQSRKQASPPAKIWPWQGYFIEPNNSCNSSIQFEYKCCKNSATKAPLCSPEQAAIFYFVHFLDISSWTPATKVSSHTYAAQFNILPIPAPRTLFQSQFFNIHATKIAASQVSHRRSTRCVPRAVVHSIFYSYCGKNLIMQKLFPP